MTLTFVSVAMAMAAFASSAFGATPYAPAGEFGDPGAGDGQFAAPRDVAVQDSTGLVFVADRDNDRVQVLAAGEPLSYLTQFGAGVLDDPVGIAIDQDTGDVYVASSAGNEIVKFNSDGQPTPTFTVDGAFTSPALGSAAGEISAFDVPLAVDQTSGDLLVADRANNRVSRYGSDGTFESSFDGAGLMSAAFTGLLDIAVDSTGDILIVDSATGQIADVVNGSPSRVERYSSTGAHEQTVGTGVPSPGAVTPDPSTDEVLIAGNMQSYNNSQPLRIYTFDPDGTPANDFPLQNQTLYSIVPGLTIGGGTTGRLYAVTDAFQGFGDVTIQAFDPLTVAPPVASTGPPAAVNEITAKLTAEVDAGNLSTRYWFEYGTTTTYGRSAPTAQDGDAGNGDAPAAVSRFVGGLEPSTLYHYRVVAQNEEGTGYGEDRSFTTRAASPPPPPADDGIPRPPGANPDGRGYEMVSPVDKQGVDVQVPTLARASTSGDRVTFSSTGAFAGAPSASANLYRAERSSDRWVTKSLNAPIAVVPGVGFAFQKWNALSDDLSRMITTHRSPPVLVPGEPEHTEHLYVRDNDADSYELITAAPPISANAEGLFVEFNDASPDFQHVAFSTYNGGGAYVEDAPQFAAYYAAGGEVELVSVQPGGSTPFPDANAGIGTSVGVPNVISDDGSRVLFTAPNSSGLEPASDAQIYMRTGLGTPSPETVHVSAPEAGVSDPAGPQMAWLRTATPDGAAVFFTSAEKLTSDSTADAATASADLYRYDVGSGDLVDLTTGDSAGAGFVGMVATSDDVSRIYFVATGALAPGATAGQPNLYLWREQAGVVHVATLDAGDADVWASDEDYSLKDASVTPDGERLAFASVAQLTGEASGGLSQVYLYDAAADVIECASCRLDGTVPSSRSTIKVQTVSVGGQVAADIGVFDRRNVTDAGDKVFFETAEPLVDVDTNARIDVYQYETDSDEVSLVSTGKGSSHAVLAAADPNGDNVFFLTRAQLVGPDGDTYWDVYDARVGGGFPEGAPPPLCEGDACQGPPTVARPDSAPATSNPGGAGNTRPPTRISLALGARIALVRGARMRVVLRVNRGGRVRAVARARIGRRSVIVARGAKTARRAGQVVLTLRLSKPARTRLAAGKRLQTSVAVQMGGARASRTVSLKLRRGR